MILKNFCAAGAYNELIHFEKVVLYAEGTYKSWKIALPAPSPCPTFAWHAFLLCATFCAIRPGLARRRGHAQAHAQAGAHVWARKRRQAGERPCAGERRRAPMHAGRQAHTRASARAYARASAPRQARPCPCLIGPRPCSPCCPLARARALPMGRARGFLPPCCLGSGRL